MGAAQSDPFYWDLDAVSRELCFSNRPWVKDPAALAAKLAAEEVDGQTLLTYELLFPRQELQEILGITTARAKAGLAEAVLSFQARSRAFLSWKKNIRRDQSIVGLDKDAECDFKNEAVLSPFLKPCLTAALNAEVHEAQQRYEQEGEASSGPALDGVPLNSFFFEPDGDSLMQMANGDSDHDIKTNSVNGNGSPPLELDHGSTPDHQSKEPSAEQSEEPFTKQIEASPAQQNEVSPAQHREEPPSKRRRLAPTNLSAKPLAESDSFPLAQSMSLNLVDPAKQHSKRSEHQIKAVPPRYAYLGEKARNRRTVLSHAESPDGAWINLGGGGFAMVSSGYMIPPGQRLVTNSILQKRLIENSRKEAMLRQGDAPARSTSPSDESDSVIDLDDLPDFWDEDTQREIDEEIEENAARERESLRYVSKERIESVLREEIAAMEAKWKETKLPRYNLKAYKIWTDSRRNERTKEKMFAARRDAERYEQRIKRLYAEILDNAWQTEREVRTQAGVMEQTLNDKLYSLWLIELFEKRDPPPKPLDMPKPKPRRPAEKTTLDPFDEELLTSSDEGDFIIPDGDGDVDVDGDGDGDDTIMADEEPSLPASQSLPLRYAQKPSYPPSEVESDMVVDLTLLDSDDVIKDSKTAIEYIDLTSPVKREVGATDLIAEKSISTTFGLPEEVPPMDQLGSLEAIGQGLPKHWAKQKDRWRLVLCLLWKLTQTRREWVLRLIQNNPPEEAWKISVHAHKKKRLTKESDIGKEEKKTAAFDIIRLLLCFAHCRQYTEARIMALDEKKYKTKIDRAQPSFPTFHLFLKEWAPRFPQSSQIFRTDAFDNEIGLDEADQDLPGITDTPSKVRKHVAKEIVQNKEGVDLREREKKRAEELEARREKLRAALATSKTISVDKSRLIINESKQDDQSFIYVNGEIGKRIKDHQIDGVRFLWEQIILAGDAKKRQGCLLAHTMGLGKTMQVITFLVAVIEAANASDVFVQAQVPEELRTSKSLILCPAGLVDNWLDEILMWSPAGLLGDVFKVESAQKVDVRMSTIRDWERGGGVLVIGHQMFEGSDDNMREMLTQTPNMVICDEAHVMKNPKSNIHRACQEFRTRSRIALTGSPLSNNVEEYYWMINWLAPNFLGPHEEFKEIYVDPIQNGLWGDSNVYEKRRALKMLEVLKMNVAPKVQRATTQCVKHELPAKYEFVLFVEPTPTQKLLYNLYLNEMAPYLADSKQVKVFGASEDLRLICNHPRCFRQKVLEMSFKANVSGLPKAIETTQQNGAEENDDDTDDDSTGRTRAPAMTFPPSMISSVLKKTNGADNADPALSRKVELLLMILDEARSIGDKVLIFSQSIPTLDYLETLLKQQRRAVCRLDGSTAVSKRQDQIKAFNTGKQEIYLISTKAGGVGLNIFGANRVVIFDFKWNPVTEQQAVGRAYRFGQEKTVYVYQFVVSGAFEEALQNKTVFKMQLASRVVDKKKPVSWGKRVGELLHPIKEKPAKDLGQFIGRDKILDKLIEHAQPSGAIRQIISTDTFEEEDPTNELTPDERKDAQELHDMQRMRHNNPEKYRMMMDQKQRAEQILAMAAAARGDATPSSTHISRRNLHILESDLYIPAPSPPATGVSGLAHSETAAPNLNTESLAQTQAASIVPFDSQVGNSISFHPEPTANIQSKAHSMPQFSSSAPLPMTGAGTHILTSNAPSVLTITPLHAATKGLESEMKPGEEVGPTSTRAVPAPSTGASLFSQPRSQAKIDFENALTKTIETQQDIKVDAANMAKRLTEEVSMAQKEQGHGFLPDNARWRLLLGHMRDHDRFGLAIAWGNCTPVYLATAPEEEIQNRIALMNSQPEDTFSIQLRRNSQIPDPSNLENIHRPLAQSVRATEDAQVMRRAADKRTERRFRLPPWANNALSKPNGQVP